MGNKWWKVKVALGLKRCIYAPRAIEDSPESDLEVTSVSSSPAEETVAVAESPRSRFLKSGSRSSKKTCSICLTTIKRGSGQAIFTAECSHTFHFHCIASNVTHGSETCPVCRAKWKDIPFQGPSPALHARPTRINPVNWPQNDDLTAVIRRLPLPRNMPRSQIPEPSAFNDDEPLDQPLEVGESNFSNNFSTKQIEVKTYPEVSSAPRFKSYDNFTVLIHLKAQTISPKQSPNRAQTNSRQISRAPRTPIDLVTILDVSGSMAGTKLALLKRAMGFVIQNLGSNDRLSVIAFSSTARRIFPLRQMSDIGRKLALQAVNALTANGGTNIVEGLKKGAKVMDDRKEKNPVASIILLSDGQDTYSTPAFGGSAQAQPSYLTPVHAFGFGTDHDASAMHLISETSGGTFSFIETESVIQDAFAQCIGGLLSVVVQELQVGVEPSNPNLRLGQIKAGSYQSRLMNNGRSGSIDVGDLYADEERDFLVSVNVPAEFFGNETSLFRIKCVFKDPLSKETVVLEDEVRIHRPEVAGQEVVSIEVDRQRNRLQAAEAMSQARATAERGDLGPAVSVLENCRRVLGETVSARAHDRLCIALDAELKEMQERMASRHVYEASGRAYILSGLSSHSWQRATARGDSTELSSIVQAYHTPSMTQMISRSQALLLNSPAGHRLMPQTLPRPR